MNKLFPAAQAIKFLSGCHARCNNLVFKLQDKSFFPELEFSCPEKIRINRSILSHRMK